MTSIRSAWETYRRGVMPRSSGFTEVAESQRAFYAGAWAALDLIGLGDAATESRIAQIAVLHEELLAFAFSADKIPPMTRAAGIGRGDEQ